MTRKPRLVHSTEKNQLLIYNYAKKSTLQNYLTDTSIRVKNNIYKIFIIKSHKQVKPDLNLWEKFSSSQNCYEIWEILYTDTTAHPETIRYFK